MPGILGCEKLSSGYSTIARPPKLAIFFNERFVTAPYCSILLDTRDSMKNTSLHILLFAKDYRPVTSRWQGVGLCLCTMMYDVYDCIESTEMVE